MTAETARQFEALERQAALIMSVLIEAGCEAVAPAIIQPADVFLDVVGEDLRARTYVFTDPEGQELCLRPDLTVPTCRLHLARHPQADATGRYCYNGSVFRFQPPGTDAASRPNEFRQAGFELIGEGDPEAAETEALALVLRALAKVGQIEFRVRMGDLGLFQALLADLEMPERGRQRLRAQFWRPEAFRTALKRLTSAAPGSLEGLPADLVGRLDPADPTAAESQVSDYMQANGIEHIGARPVAEITAGLLAAVEDARAEPIPAATARLIESYLEIEGPAPQAGAALQRKIGMAGPRSAKAVAAFTRRLTLLADAGIDTSALAFDAEFGRTLEYYTGFVFDLVSPTLGDKAPIAGGGRYDRLLRAAGAPRDVPAVGSAIHTERLLSVVSGGTP
jgi:ATP phosphoribosyltransferase regulatory subunit